MEHSASQRQLHDTSYLDSLDGAGLKVDTHGRVKDWADRPGHTARPILPAPQDDTLRRRRRKNEFTSQEEEELLHWCSAAEQEGVLRGSDVFQQIECLRPAHSWQAYEGKWRRSNLSSRTRPSLDSEVLFPNLSSPTEVLASIEQSGNVHNVVGVAPHTIGVASVQSSSDTSHSQLEEALTYSDFRVDIAHRLYRRLGFAGEDEFVAFLQQEWVLDAYLEYVASLLNSTRAADEASLNNQNLLPRSNRGRAPHRWKIERSVEVIRDQVSRYASAAFDKSLWTNDDHDIRFMVVLTQGAMASQTVWCPGSQTDVASVSEKSFWLMLWLQWVYKPVSGTSTEMKRIRLLKEEWRTVLSGLVGARLQATVLTSPVFVPAITATATARDDVRPVEIEVGADRMWLEPSMITTQGGLAGHAEIPGSSLAELLDKPSALEHVGTNATDLSGGTSSGGEGFRTSPVTPAGSSPNLGAASTSAQLPDARQHQPLQTLQTPQTPPKIGWSRDPVAKPPKLAVPRYSPSLAKNKNQHKGAFWLTEDAYLAYKNHRDARMADWGVTSEHNGTCILVLSEWANVKPETLIDSFVWNNLSMEERKRISREDSSRLHLSIGDVTVAWARASVWFESWPDQARTGVELDAFFQGQDNPYTEVDASHLCHHGLCINKNHLVGESHAENMSRKECAMAARNLRSYGSPIPKKCIKHKENSCLLQHAALTTCEALQIQCNVLRRSLGRPENTTVTRPDDHASWLPTFEVCPPISFAPTICIRDEYLVSTTDTRPRALEKFTFRCPFCLSVQQRWSQVTAYWSHLKLLHEEKSRDERLVEIQRSAQSYTDWIEARFSDYERSNADTWSKLKQALADDFNWDVVQGWRLHMDRHYERWVANAAQDLADGH